MPTRKELIDQVRDDQRSRSARTRDDNPKSAIVGIGDRDPLTGLYDVLLPDGSVEMGEKQFNSSLPKGSQVLGVPQSTGGWLLDERDVQPIKPPLQPSPMGKVKVLFSTIEGNDRVFYLWGDRPKPKRIGIIPATGEAIDFDFASWTISNRGKGDRFIANVKWREPGFYNPEGFYTAPTHTQAFGDQVWEYINPPERLGFVYNDFYLGHGFWSSTKYWGFSYIFSFTPVVILHPTSYSLYKGVPTSYAGNLSVTAITTDGAEYINSQTLDLDTAISPTQTRHNHSFITGAGTEQSIFFVPIAISKDESFVLYGQAPPVGSQTIRLFLVNNSIETELGGEIPLSAFYYRLGGLIGSQYFKVKPPTDLSKSQWDVDIYKLGANTTKSTIKAKVTYKHKTGMTFHNASYHP